MSEAQAVIQPAIYLHLIVLLINFYVNVRICTFVEYSKAFDSINRAMFWKKLVSYGASGKVLNVILNNMYKSIKCVMKNGMQSECFDSHV